jgi:phosphatidylglycerol lysyltransferase
MNKKHSIPADTQYFSSHDQMSENLVRKLETMAYEHGRYYDSYIITEPNRHYFWSQNEKGVVGFHINGRYINVASGLIAHPEDKSTLIKDFIQFAKANGYVLSLFSLDQKDADHLQSHGFEVTKYGEETAIHLDGWTWSGKKFEWVRRQANYVKRQNVIFQELCKDDYSEKEWTEIINELDLVSEEHLSSKPQKKAIPLFEGELNSDHLYRRRIFIAKKIDEGSENRIEGFILCNPYENGKKWGIELYRQRSDAVRGTIPFMMYHVINLFQDEDHQTVSLCPIPALRCAKPLKNDSKTIRLFLGLWYKRLNFIFDVEGLYHFKSRFRPEFNDMYVCVYPKATLFSIFGYIRCIKIASVRKRFLLKLLFKRLTQRKTLARVSNQSKPATIPLKQKPAHKPSDKNLPAAG